MKIDRCDHQMMQLKGDHHNYSHRLNEFIIHVILYYYKVTVKELGNGPYPTYQI